MEKRIEDFPDYGITDDGKIFSYKHKTPRQMKTWLQKAGYENIQLSKDGATYHKLVHRLVAEAFIPNPENLPEVNHKNKIRNDNRVENLEWCTRMQNLIDSYSTMSPVRNYRNCTAYFPDGKLIGEYKSIAEACRELAKQFNLSYSSLNKYHECRGYKIIPNERPSND